MLVKAKSKIPLSLAALSFMFVAVAVLLARQNPAMGYELDIYASTPLLTWILLGLAMTIGVAIILHQLFTKCYESSNSWFLGLFVMVVARFGFLWIPHIRGYETFGGDNISYVGNVISILESGHFLESDFYPVVHSFLTSISLFTDLNPLFLSTLMPAVISVISVFSICLLAKATGINKQQWIIVTTISAAIFLGGFYNFVITPNGWSILLIPFIFYLYFKKVEVNYVLLLIIFLVLYPFFHPLSSLIVIICLTIIEITMYIFNMIKTKISTDTNQSYVKYTLNFILIEMVILFPWLLSFNRFHPNVRILWEQITTGLHGDRLEYLIDRANRIEAQGMDLVALIGKLFGDAGILIILSCIAIAFLLFNKNQFLKHNVTNKLLPLGFVMIFCGLLYGAYLLGLPGMAALGAGQYDRRILGYVQVIAPLFSGICAYLIYTIVKHKKITCCAIISVLIVASFLSMRNVHPSPFILQPSGQVTTSDLHGAKWFIDKKNKELNTGIIMTSLNRLSDGIYGWAYRSERLDITRGAFQFEDHFGDGLLGSQLEEPTYAVFNKHDRLIYETVWKTVGRFRTEDFNKLTEDNTVSKIYDNGEFDAYYVYTLP
jgi:hypothetical protein